MNKTFAVYILANERPTLYVGMTNNLIRRIYEHIHELNKNSFSSRYKLKKLVFFEFFETAESAIIRERQIKNLNRKDKLDLIKSKNPEMFDLFDELL